MQSVCYWSPFLTPAPDDDIDDDDDDDGDDDDDDDDDGDGDDVGDVDNILGKCTNNLPTYLFPASFL